MPHTLSWNRNPQKDGVVERIKLEADIGSNLVINVLFCFEDLRNLLTLQAIFVIVGEGTVFCKIVWEMEMARPSYMDDARRNFIAPNKNTSETGDFQSYLSENNKPRTLYYLHNAP
jgi:hypothetical protein